MANSVDDQLYDLTQEINRLVRLFGGNTGNSPFAPTKSPLVDKISRASSGGGRGRGHHYNTITDSVRKMHNGVEGFTDALGTVARKLPLFAAELGVLIEVFEGAIKIGRTFTKLT